MDKTNWEEVYGPPAINPTYQVGQTLVYVDLETKAVENGEILYVGQGGTDDPKDVCYVVSPAIAAFPAPVYTSQVITAL